MNKKFNIIDVQLLKSHDKNFHEVVCDYTIDGVKGREFVFIENKDKASNAYYLKEAKNRLYSSFKDGKLGKTKSPKSNKLWIITTAVASVAAIAFASVFTWKHLTSTGGGDVPPPPPTPTDYKWYLDDEYINSLTEEDVGTMKTVEVNGNGHLVRLIGVDHDEFADGTTAHTTWEFANLISDKNGYSLATFWNDVKRNDVQYACPCGDYFNSSIRYALVGEGNPVSHGWYEKDAGTKSTEYTESVIEMLPDDLAEKIKPVKKTVISFEDGADPRVETNYVPVECCDKLFMLSFSEICDYYPEFQYRNTGNIYKYYEGYVRSNDPETNTAYRLIKRHFASNFVIEGNTFAVPVTDSKQEVKVVKDIESTAGYNSTNSSAALPVSVPCGGGYWLRDLCPNIFQGDITAATEAAPTCASSGGDLCVAACNAGHGDGNELAAPIAPAFCL